MPRYTFRCSSCAAEREVTASFETAETLELMCYACGNDMIRAPVLTLNVIGPATARLKAEKKREERAYFAKACGHNHACRCGVKIDKPNPFREQIREVHGFTSDI